MAYIELKAGNYIITNYDSTKTRSDSSSIRLPTVNYLPGELMTLKVELNGNFSAKTINEDQNLQELVQFTEIGSGKTKIISSMVGWGTEGMG